MKILIFKDVRWQDIKDEDNPTYHYINHKTRGKIRREQAILVCKVASPKYSSVGDGYCVIFVPIEGDIIRRGLFWNFDDACVFAESIRGL